MRARPTARVHPKDGHAGDTGTDVGAGSVGAAFSALFPFPRRHNDQPVGFHGDDTPAEAAFRPLSGSNRYQRITVFGLVGVVVLAMAIAPPRPSSVVMIAAVLGFVFIVVAMVWVPWGELKPWGEAIPAMMSLIILFALRDDAGGLRSGYGGAVVMILIWLALYHSRAVLLVGLGIAVLGLSIPGGEYGYTPADARTTALAALAGVVIGLPVNAIVARQRATAASLAAAGRQQRRESRFMTSILDHSAALVLVLDPQGRIVLFNSACERATGYPAAEVRGKRPWEVFAAPEDAGRQAGRFHAALASLADTAAPSAGYVETWYGRNGQPLAVRWIDTSLPDSDGSVSYVLRSGLDRTELQRSESMLRRVLDAATGQAVIATDVNGVITLFNAGAEQLLGYRATDVIGRRAAIDLLDPDNPLVMAMKAGKITPTQVFRPKHSPTAEDSQEWTYVRADGKRLRMSLISSTLTDDSGAVIGYLGTSRDITTELATTEALRAAYEHERTLADQLRQLDRAKTDFIAAASHDLRTPLTSVLAYLSLAIEEPDPIDQQREFVAIAHRNAVRLMNLVENVLTVSRIDAGTLDLYSRPVCVRAAVTTALESLTGSTSGRDLDIVVDIEPDRVLVQADPEQLQRVFINLIGNAVKFTPDGGRILLSARRTDDMVEIEVTDSGRGIPENELSQVFSRFFRSSTTEDVSGTGLGLSIVKAIIEAHGGRVMIRSTVGRGTTVHVIMPASRPASDAEADGEAHEFACGHTLGGTKNAAV